MPAQAAARAPEALRCQLAVSVHQPSGRLVTAGQLQIPGVIDHLYAAAADAELGPAWHQGTPTPRLWAPTARDVAPPAVARRHRPAPSSRSVTRWFRHPTARGRSPANRRGAARYRFEVTVFTPHHRKVVVNRVTDHSTSLTVNSTHSVLVDLSDPELAPAQWLAARPPVLERRVDQVIYELHLRDFSISDRSVPAYDGAASSHPPSPAPGWRTCAGWRRPG